MKYHKKSLLTLLMILVWGLLFAQDIVQQKVKKGWNFGPLPAISYNSDLGFQYGALCDIYYFGDGSKFPAYLHKFNVEVSRYTKGSGVYHIFYDSKYLIKGVRATVDVSYLTDQMMDFYGYNGYMSVYDEFRGASYFKMDRRLMRATADFQGKLGGNFGWAAGIGYYKYNIGSVKLDQYESEPSLYKEYISTGLINADEAKGGTRIELKLGLVHDTRDHEADPSKGFWSEAILIGAKDYLKFSLVHRGYVPLYKERLTFAYRVAYQGTMVGEQPFYMMQNLSSLYMSQITNEGLGGLNSLRGVLRNRVVGAGVAWTNIELRYRFFNFKFLSQDWYLALNPFLDAGLVVQYYKKSELESAPLTSPSWSSSSFYVPG
jgi:outer membrane protein assembly factor BamA